MSRRSACHVSRRIWLVAWLAALGCSRHPTSGGRPTRPASALPVTASAPGAPTVTFVDVTRQAGIQFRHTNGGSGRKYLPETMGSGCAFFDFDGDGWLDILLLNDRPISETGRAGDRSRPVATAALYRNNRDGTFADVTRGSGLDVPLYAMGCCAGDYDNDGREDLFITTCLEPNRLFHNEGGGKFRDVTARAGVGDRRWGTSCAWVDYDRDGWLDLFVCNYVRFRTLADDKFCSLVAYRKSYCPPGAYAGEACILYRNNRDGSFRDVSRETGIAPHIGNSLGIAVLDFDDDGWPDIAVANDETPNFLFHNVSGGGWKRPPVRGDRTGIGVGRRRKRQAEGRHGDRYGGLSERWRAGDPGQQLLQ
jgi:enediyne biosynthesis protein E4